MIKHEPCDPPVKGGDFLQWLRDMVFFWTQKAPKPTHQQGSDYQARMAWYKAELRGKKSS